MSEATWKRPAILLNRESGTIARLGPDAVAAELRELFAAQGIEPIIELIGSSDLCASLARVCESDADAIIIGGGDGTVATAATALVGNTKPLGILPLGTFNLAARDVGMPLTIPEAVEALCKAPIAEMDLLEVAGELCCCVVVMGFYPALALRRPEYHGSWIVKTWKLLRETVASITTYPPLHLLLKDRNGVEVRRRTRIAVIANNDYDDMFGLIPRRSGLDGGFFTVYVSTHQSRWGLLKSLFVWVLGRWKHDRELTVFHTSDLEINVRGRRHLAVMRDGEVSRLTVPFRISVRPKAVRVMAPRLLQP